VLDQALGADFTGLRLAGQMDWAIEHEQDCDVLVEYEAKLNGLLPSLRLTALCLYDRRTFSPEVVRDAIRTHPVVILRDEVCPNHLYEPPELFLNVQGAEKRVEWMVSRLVGEKPAARKATVMIVDDDQFIRFQLKQTVETMGYRTVKAEDEQEMIETALRERPDIILTSTDLKWLDRLIARLREVEELRFLPIAAVYQDPPEGFRDERLIVLENYDQLVTILPLPEAPS
jgi:CheY-like chemotaxis protein